MESGLYWRFKNDDIIFDIKKYIKSNDLDGILNYEGLIQEIKSENMELLNFLVKEENLKKILSYIIEESDEKDNYDKSYKFPYKSHQIISSENKLIIDSIVYNNKLMKYFWKFILNKNQLNEVLAGYFSRCAIAIYNKNTKDVVNFLKKKKEVYLKAFLYHFYSRNITELFKVLLFVKVPYLCIFENKDIIYLILSNLDGNFCDHSYVPSDREDNITCLIRDIFVRKTEIYYFNYFLIDLASQLSFSYLIKCVFSNCPHTISASITIISDLLHYTVLAKSYNNIDFYECLELYNKEEELKKSNIEELEKFKKKKKRKSNKIIEKETSNKSINCIQKEDNNQLQEQKKENMVNDIINNITNLDKYEKEKREIEKNEIEKEDINKEKQLNNLNKKIKEENSEIDLIKKERGEEEEEKEKEIGEEEKEKEKEQKKDDVETNEINIIEKELELNNIFANNNMDTNYFSSINKENNLNEDNGNKENLEDIKKKENMKDFNYSGNQKVDEREIKSTNSFNDDNILNSYCNDYSNNNASNTNYNSNDISSINYSNNNNSSINFSNNDTINNGDSTNAIDNISHLSNNEIANEKKNHDNKNYIMAETSNLFNIPYDEKNDSINSEQNKNENAYNLSDSNKINSFNYKESKNGNSDNDNCDLYTSEPSSEEDDDSLEHLKKIKFDEVLNKMKKIARNKINKKDGIMREEKSKDLFIMSHNSNILNENNKEDTFHIFQKEEGDANIPLAKWIEYLENSTFVDICFFSYIKDIMKLYIKNINKNKNKNILGFTTLEIIQLIKTLIKTKSKNILTEIIDEGFFDISIDIFFKYKWNNLLHISVCDLLQTIIFKENEYSYLLYYILALTTFLPKCLRFFDAVRRCRNIKNKKKKKKFESLIDCGYKAHLLHICQILSNKSLEIKWLSNFLVTVSGWNDIIIDELNHYSLYFNDANYSDEKKTEEVDHNEISNLCNDNKKDLENNDNNFNEYSNVIDILFDENKNGYTNYENDYHKNNSDYSLSSNCNFNNMNSENVDSHNTKDSYNNTYENNNEHNTYEEKYDNYDESNDYHNSKDIQFSDNCNNYIYEIKNKIDNSDNLNNDDNNNLSSANNNSYNN